MRHYFVLVSEPYGGAQKNKIFLGQLWYPVCLGPKAITKDEFSGVQPLSTLMGFTSIDNLLFRAQSEGLKILNVDKLVQGIHSEADEAATDSKHNCCFMMEPFGPNKSFMKGEGRVTWISFGLPGYDENFKLMAPECVSDFLEKKRSKNKKRQAYPYPPFIFSLNASGKTGCLKRSAVLKPAILQPLILQPATLQSPLPSAAALLCPPPTAAALPSPPPTAAALVSPLQPNQPATPQCPLQAPLPNAGTSIYPVQPSVPNAVDLISPLPTSVALQYSLQLNNEEEEAAATRNLQEALLRYRKCGKTSITFTSKSGHIYSYCGFPVKYKDSVGRTRLIPQMEELINVLGGGDILLGMKIIIKSMLSVDLGIARQAGVELFNVAHARLTEVQSGAIVAGTNCTWFGIF
jgi:hypothetical protein